MRKYHLWKLDKDYAISDFGKNEIDFATHKDFSLDFKKISTLKTELASKPALLEFLEPLITGHGVHPIFNTLGQKCQQIVNVPTHVLSSEEILEYLNGYTILPQSTPPYEEIIYKLACYSQILTDEYFDKESKSLNLNDLAKIFVEDDKAEIDTDEHFIACAPKIFEEKKGHVFHLPKPTRAHRKWIILDEYYDNKKNAWIDGEGKVEKRDKPRIEFADKKKEITTLEISQKKKEFFASGGEVTKLEAAWEEKELDWMALKIHPLAHLIPFPKNEERAGLKEDIRLNGVHEELVLFEGKILDGRTRQGICIELGIRPKYKTLPREIDPRKYVISMGIRRRHLTSSQISAFGVVELLPDIEIEAKERQKKRSKDYGMVQIPDHVQGTASEVLAEFLKVGEKYIRDAKKIKEESPDLFEKILSGSLTITAAKKQLKPSLATKRKTRKPFEKMYREMLQAIMNSSEPNNSIRGTTQILPVLKQMSDIYLLWNRRNDKRVIKMLEEMKIDFDGIFGEKKERHLHLLEM